MGNAKQGRKKVPVETPKSIKVAFHLYTEFFRWSFEKCFWGHSGWIDCTNLQFFAERIISKLQDFESMKWQEILESAGGKSEGKGTNNHFINAEKLPKKEKVAFEKRGFKDQFDEVFSLRLSGEERLFGVVDLNKFYVLWYDAEHKFFPVKLKHA